MLMDSSPYARIEFSSWEAGVVSSYTLFVNWQAPEYGGQLINGMMGSERCGAMSLDELPQCLAVPIRMRKVRGRDTDTAILMSNTVLWLQPLRLTSAEDIDEIVRRDKWEFHREFHQKGESLYERFRNSLSQEKPTEALG